MHRGIPEGPAGIIFLENDTSCRKQGRHKESYQCTFERRQKTAHVPNESCRIRQECCFCINTESGSVSGECSWHELREGDIILLCSDGITKGISLETIKEVVYEKDMPALELVKMAEKRSADNLTAVVIQNGLHLASE